VGAHVTAPDSLGKGELSCMQVNRFLVKGRDHRCGLNVSDAVVSAIAIERWFS
jgi:hypothetical protein